MVEEEEEGGNRKASPVSPVAVGGDMKFSSKKTDQKNS
jgi:hypothetical protein